MCPEELQPAYDLEKLQIGTPQKRDFRMVVDQEHVNHYITNAYEDFSADLLLNLFKDGSLFIDIGAHYGFYSLLMAAKYKNSQIMAFEPVPENCAVLKRSLELNDIGNVTVYNLAVSDKCETRDFHVREFSSHGGFYDHLISSKTLRTIKVETVALDSLLRDVSKVGIVIKINTEGHEICVLRGMRNLLSNTNDVILLVEFNPLILRKAGYKPEDLLTELSQLDFDVYFIDDERRETYKLAESSINNWDDYFRDGNFPKEYCNILCIKKKKSLSVCFFSPSAQLGGAERSLLELTTELTRYHGAVCSVVLPGDGPLKQRLELTGVSTLIVPYDWWCDISKPPIEEISHRFGDSYNSLINKFKHQLDKVNPDVVVTNTIVIPWGALLASLLGKPHVWFIREFGELDHGLEFFLPFQSILDVVRNSSNLVFTNSNAVKNELFRDSSDTNVMVIRTHVDETPVASHEDDEVYFTRRTEANLIITGFINQNMGQWDAILAVKELVQRGRDVELIIMGGGDPAYLERLRAAVRDWCLESYIKFMGFRPDPYIVVNQADIILVCSRSEGFGRVTLEAMLLRKPVIGTASGGTPELVKEGFNGFLYEPGNHVQLADKIEYLIEHREKMKELGENGYKLAKEDFTRDAYAGELFQLLMNLKNKPNPATNTFSQFVSQATLAGLSALRRTMEDKDSQIGGLANALQARDGQIAQLTNALQARDGQIQQMQQGITMQLLARYQRVVEKLLRSGSRRRHYYELWLAGFRIILNEGWQSFWRKFRSWGLGRMSERDGYGQNRRIEYARKYIRGIGIEIGPLHRRLELPPNVVVRYVGRLSWRIIGVLSRITKGYKVISPGIMDNVTKLEKMNDESYDFCICNHLLEHIDNPIEAITNWLRVLKPGGILYIAVPDASNPLDTGQEITTTEHLVQDHQADIPSYVQSIGLDSLDMRVIDSAGNKINGIEEYIYIIEKANYVPKIVEMLEKTPQIMDTNAKYLVDVVVPIYNAYEDFEKCLYSLFKYQDIYRIVLIDDCSTDKRVKELLHTLKKHECERFRVIENEENVGFVRTVNKGMKMSKSDIILLNTDTIVTKGWAEKMRACAHSSSSIATVNPFSNNCVVCTIPGGIPEGFTIDSFAECVEIASFKQYPELVTAYGFCMYIKRDAIDKLGYFDEESFGKGYGEEADFCLRAIQKGYRNVLCDNTLVFHKGQASFLDAAGALNLNAKKVLSERYPVFFPMMTLWWQLNPLKELHDNIKLRMATWNISGGKG